MVSPFNPPASSYVGLKTRGRPIRKRAEPVRHCARKLLPPPQPRRFVNIAELTIASPVRFNERHRVQRGKSSLRLFIGHLQHSAKETGIEPVQHRGRIQPSS